MNLTNLALPYLHSVAALIFVSLHIGIRMHAGFYLVLEKAELLKHLKYLKAQLLVMIICALIMVISSLLLSSFSDDPIFSTLASTQSSLYAFSLVNLLYVLFLCNQASKLNTEQLAEPNEKLALVIYYFVPLNILLSLVGLLLTLILDSTI